MEIPSSKNTQTIDDITRAVQESFPGGLSEKKARKLVDTVLREISRGLIKKRVLVLEDFGTFTFLRTKERIGVNPHTGEEVRAPATTAVTFQAAETFEATLDFDLS